MFPANLAGFSLEAASPLAHPGRTLFTVLFASYFTYLAMRILSSVKVGITLEVHKRSPWDLKVHSGKQKSSKTKSSTLKSYNGPLATAILGLFLYAAAHLLIVMAFKVADYYFI